MGVLRRQKASSRRWAGVSCAAAIAVAASLAAPAAQADTLEAWRKAADRVIAIYEQSSAGEKEYDAVSPDFDCQGLSLGSKQWPFRNGSIRRILSQLSKADLERTVRDTMPTHGDVFLRAAEQSLARRHAEARRTTLQLQRVQNSGCQGPKGVGLKAGVQAEIGAWLTTPEVLAAQQADERRISDKAVALAVCWAERIGGPRPPAFNEYLFFYDFLTQNGGAWVEDYILIDAFDTVDYRQYGKGEAELVAEKMSVIIQFYETDWRVSFAKGYLRDAKKNAAVLQARLEAGAIGESEVGLLLIKLFRNILGNTPFGLTSMNRGVISLTGQGAVNGAVYDVRDEIAARSALSPGEAPQGLSCRRP